MPTSTLRLYTHSTQLPPTWSVGSRLNITFLGNHFRPSDFNLNQSNVLSQNLVPFLQRNELCPFLSMCSFLQISGRCPFLPLDCKHQRAVTKPSMDDKESAFDFKEGAWEMATTVLRFQGKQSAHKLLTPDPGRKWQCSFCSLFYLPLSTTPGHRKNITSAHWGNETWEAECLERDTAMPYRTEDSAQITDLSYLAKLFLNKTIYWHHCLQGRLSVHWHPRASKVKETFLTSDDNAEGQDELLRE